MAFPRSHYATNISDRLSELALKVKVRSRANLTDANNVIEPIICRLFNALFGWQLVNLNSSRSNYPAIDLGDRFRKIAVQVTNEEGSGKIAQTVLSAEEHGLKADFQSIIIFFLLQRKPGFPKNFVQPGSGPTIEVWDITDVLRRAHELDNLEMLRQASAVLDEELQSIDLPRGIGSARPDGHTFEHGAYGLESTTEGVYTSFFQVTYPSSIYQAQIKLKRGIKFSEKFDSQWSAIETKEAIPVDYLVEDGMVYTFDSLNQPIWKALIANGTLQVRPSFASEHWSRSEKRANLNLFIKLLQRNLNQLCNHVGTANKLAYSKGLRCYLFQAETGKLNGSIKVPAIKKSGTREIVKAIVNTLPDRKSEIQHWKHLAFRSRFVTFGGNWYLNIEPFWAFTCDGKNSPSRWHDTSSRNMKKPERNRAVLGHIMFWASLLCKETDMLSYPISIRVLRPSKIDVSPSIVDDDWKTIAPPAEKETLINDSLEELLIP